LARNIGEGRMAPLGADTWTAIRAELEAESVKSNDRITAKAAWEARMSSVSRYLSLCPACACANIGLRTACHWS